MPLAYTFLIIILMLVFNAIFAAYEMALASIARIRLTVLVAQKKKGAQEALFMKDRIEASLAVVQLGITFVGAIAAATGGIGATNLLEPRISQLLELPTFLSEALALVLIVVPLSCFTIIFAELVPKTFALNNKEEVCLKLSPLMKILWQMLNPLIVFLERVVKTISRIGSKKAVVSPKLGEGLHELRAAASMARTLRVIGAREEKMVISITELPSRPVREIIIAAMDISMIPMSFSLSDAFVRAHLDMHTRFPVCSEDNNPQSIVGYVNFKDILFALHVNPSNPTLQGITRPIKSVNAGTMISSVLEEMMQESAHISLVRDDQGKILGMVTLEDLIEELVGEIKDEYDRLPNYVHPYFDGWVMGGGVLMSTVASATGLPKLFTQEPTGRIPTLAEWCAKIKKGLKGGDIFEIDGLTITVRKLRRRQLAEAIVEVTKPKSA
ncbi:MAG: hemolysin family protein [Candidatus Omnitrophota bacterium]